MRRNGGVWLDLRAAGHGQMLLMLLMELLGLDERLLCERERQRLFWNALSEQRGKTATRPGPDAPGPVLHVPLHVGVQLVPFGESLREEDDSE